MSFSSNYNALPDYPVNPAQRVILLSFPREPTSADVKDNAGRFYQKATIWQVGKDPTTGTEGDLFILSKIVNSTASWIQISGGTPTNAVLTLSDTADTLVSPDMAGNIQLEGTMGQVNVTSDALNNKLVLSLPGTFPPTTEYDVDSATPPGTDPTSADGLGSITFTGGQLGPGTVSSVIQTASLAANSITWQIQQSDAAAAKDVDLNGVSHYDSAQFTVDEGFVQLIGGVTPPTMSINVDANTPPGTDPVVPTAGGAITLEGGATFATNTQANPIRTNSLAANTIDLQIQLAGAAAGSSSANRFGVCQFDDNQFDVTSGFVQLAGGGTAPGVTKVGVDASSGGGTDPVVADATGLITVTGAQVAAGAVGANVIRTDSTAANAYTIEIQRADANATTDSTKNGVAHFKSTDFSVDANGFVSLLSPGAGLLVQQVRNQSTTAVSTSQNFDITGTTPTTSNTDIVISATITPSNASSILVFEFAAPFANVNDNIVGFFLFQGTTLLSCFPFYSKGGVGGNASLANFIYYATAGTTSSTTYDVYFAAKTATTRLLQNSSGTALYGGAGNTAITFMITEYSS